MKKVTLNDPIDCKAAYLTWLLRRSEFQPAGNGTLEIAVPLLDIDGDYIQVYVSEKEGKFHFSDNGYTFENLESHGFSNVGEEIQPILRMFGVSLQGKEIAADGEEFSPTLHKILHAVWTVNAMYLPKVLQK